MPSVIIMPADELVDVTMVMTAHMIHVPAARDRLITSVYDEVSSTESLPRLALAVVIDPPPPPVPGSCAQVPGVPADVQVQRFPVWSGTQSPTANVPLTGAPDAVAPT